MMAWRVIAYGDKVWNVDALAERPADSHAWHLRLSFRVSSGRMQEPALWTDYPLAASSRSALFLQAERIPDTALARLLAERLA
jgi:hypothetical protein